MSDRPSVRDFAQTVVQALYEKASLEQAEAAELCLYAIVKRAEEAERCREALEQIAAQPRAPKWRKMEIARVALEAGVDAVREAG